MAHYIPVLNKQPQRGKVNRMDTLGTLAGKIAATALFTFLVVAGAVIVAGLVQS